MRALNALMSQSMYAKSFSRLAINSAIMAFSLMTRDLSELISNARHSWKDLFQLLFLVNVTGIINICCFLGPTILFGQVFFVRLMPICFQVVLYCIVSRNVSLTESGHLNSCISRRTWEISIVD